MLLNKAFDLLNEHRVAGDILLMITATHAVVAEPVAARLAFNIGLAVAWVCRGLLHRPCRGRALLPRGQGHPFAQWRAQHPEAVLPKHLVLLRLAQ